MKKVEKLFGGLKMGWKEVIIFSLAVGVFCGIFGGMPALTDTSFTDMAGGYEWWILWAVIIVVNCDKYYDAGLKCGVFFLITQPLQFYIQAFLYSGNYDNAYRYFIIWLPVIIATFLGGAIAYFSKKENILGASIIGIGGAMEVFSFVHYVYAFIKNPPRHLIAALISIISAIIMIYCLQKQKKNRMIAYGIALILPAIITIYAIVNHLSL